jgi:hypothetical protein
MADKATSPHQDPIHHGLRKQPTDGLAAAQLDIEDLQRRIAEVGEATGQGDGILKRQIDELNTRIDVLQARIDGLLVEIRKLQEAK